MTCKKDLSYLCPRRRSGQSCCYKVCAGWLALSSAVAVCLPPAKAEAPDQTPAQPQSKTPAPVSPGRTDSSGESSGDPADRKAEARRAEEQILVRVMRRERLEVKMGGQLGALGNVKGLDAPFNIHAYTDSLILNQQSQTLGQVLRNDPSVRTTYGYGNFSEVFVIRGFPVYGDDVAINGLYGITPRQLVSPQLYGQVQVLNGASAFLNGAAPGGSAVGGNINLMFKHAGKDPLTRLTGDYSSGAQGGGSLDAGRRFGAHGELGVRLNVAGMDGQTAIHHEKRHSDAVGLDVDYRNPSNTTRVSLDMDYQYQGVNWGRPALLPGSVTSLPKHVKPAYNYGQRWSYNDLNYIFGMLNAEHDFSPSLTAYAAFGGLGGNEKGNYGTPTLTDSRTGMASVSAMYVPLIQTNESLRAGIRGKFYVFGVKNKINAGGSSLWEEMDTAYAMASAGQTGSIYRMPQYSAPREDIVGDIRHPKKNSRHDLYSLFFSDTASFWNDRIAITSGFRYQHFLISGYDYTTRRKTSSYDKEAITPVAGAVFHPTRKSALYFNRIEGLSPGPQAMGNVVNVGEIFAPYRTTQYEAGAKYDAGFLSASMAFYRMSQPTTYTEALANGQQRFTMDGMQRNQGVELALNGQIFPGLRLNGGSALIDAKEIKGDHPGKKAIGIPGYTINGDVEYDLPFFQGATLIGRAAHTGRQWADVGNTLRLKQWTTFDIGGRYSFLFAKRAATARFGIQNIANQGYWSSAFGGYLLAGAPRTFTFSISMDV